MTDLDEQGRPEPPLAANETASVLGLPDYQRATLAWKYEGLGASGLQATVAVSAMSRPPNRRERLPPARSEETPTRSVEIVGAVRGSDVGTMSTY